MTKTIRALALVTLLPAALQGQQVGPAIQKIATATSLSTERLGIVNTVRELPNGNVLVNDIQRRRLLLMDSTMKVIGVVLDSVSSNANAYGTRPGTLIPFRGDTTFFIDPASYAMVTIDPAGKPGRVRSVWRVEDLQYFTEFGGPVNGWPGADAKGRIIYRKQAQATPPKVRPPAGVPYMPPEPDSGFVVGVNLDTRRVDTLAVLRLPKREMRFRKLGDRGYTIDQVINPLPTTDEWAVLPDGSVAIVRGVDYRVEYLHADGTRTSSAKLPFDWQRLTDEDKTKLIDSVKVVQQKQSTTNFVSSMIAWVNQYNRMYPKNFTVPEGFVPRPGFPKDWILPPGVKFPANYIYACPPGTGDIGSIGPPVGSAPGAPPCFPAPISFSTGSAPPPPTPRPVIVMAESDLPDYRPPFPASAVLPDRDGNLWIKTNPMKPTPGGPVFDIVSPAGELTNRIQLLPGYAIVGFGKGRIVYLSTRDATGIHVARVRLK
jgi:hypothetical protein